MNLVHLQLACLLAPRHLSVYYHHLRHSSQLSTVNIQPTHSFFSPCCLRIISCNFLSIVTCPNMVPTQHVYTRTTTLSSPTRVTFPTDNKTTLNPSPPDSANLARSSPNINNPLQSGQTCRPRCPYAPLLPAMLTPSLTEDPNSLPHPQASYPTTHLMHILPP